MNNQVTIVANSKTGAVVSMRTITDKNTGETREVGSVMVQSKALTGLSGLGRVQTRTAFVTLEQEALEFLGGHLNDGAILPVPGKIIIEETLTPYVRKDGTKQEPKINPTTKAVITFQGQPVYRNTYFSEDVNAQDTFLRETPAMAGASSEDSPE